MSVPSVDAVVVCNDCFEPMALCECNHPPYREGDPLRAVYSGKVEFAGVTLKCHVLNNGVRVFDADDIESLFS